MSPPGTPSSPPAQIASPYANRPISQPKSARRQFTACGACRMRRVRCDLKDLPPSVSSHASCSNCKERGLNCVDEYADIKTIKLLRRGRRLQQVEAIYGKVKGNRSSVPSSRTPNNIPALKANFFSSDFWAWFCTQRPVLDPNDFSQRYLAHVEGRSSIGPEGMILSMLLVLWAASFGLDESGTPIRNDYDSGSMHQDPDSRQVIPGSPSHTESSPADGNHRQPKISLMLEQILELIDSNSLLRRPTLDGARVLLLVLPLMEECSYPEKAIMYEAALSHTRILYNPRAPLPLSSPSPSTTEESVGLTRIALYAHIQEGITTALKGNHIVFNNDDVDTLQRMTSLPIDHSRLSPFSSTFLPEAAASSRLVDKRTVPVLGKQLVQLSSMPLRLSLICRKSHEILTGLKPARRIGEHHLVDANGLREVWRDLEQCWQGFVAMRKDAFADFEKVNIEYFTDAWLICIFECHYSILESLKRLASATNPDGLSIDMSDHNAVSRTLPRSEASSPYLPPNQLYLEARTRCVHLLPHILRIVRHHLTKGSHVVDMPNLFTWDTGLVRDGCFFAGLLAADIYGDSQCLDEHQVKPEETSDCISPEEGVNLILSAFAEMHWVFSKCEERSETIRSALQRSKEKHQGRRSAYPGLLQNTFGTTNPYAEHNHNRYLPYTLHPYSHRGDIDVVAGLRERRTLPNLSIPLLSQRRVESAPNTACSTDTSGWPTYTPPTTANTAPILGSRGSPGFNSPYGGDHDEAIFSFMPGTLDDFVQNPTADRAVASVFPDRIYQHRDSLYDPHDINRTAETASAVFGL